MPIAIPENMTGSVADTVETLAPRYVGNESRDEVLGFPCAAVVNWCRKVSLVDERSKDHRGSVAVNVENVYEIVNVVFLDKEVAFLQPSFSCENFDCSSSNVVTEVQDALAFVVKPTLRHSDR